MEFTLHQLRLLREVANRSTIAAAAEALGYTPSAVSQQLSSLEKSIGVPVLERIGRNVRLTDAGRELVQHADGLLAQVEAARVAVEKVHGEVTGQVEISVYESVAATLLPAMLAALAVEHPGVRVRTRQMDPDAALAAVAMGDLDAAFSIDYLDVPGPRPAGLEFCAVLDDRFHLVVPASDPPTVGPVALASLAGRPFISSPPSLSCGRFVIGACRQAGFEPDLVHQVDDYPTSLRLVAAGQGVALIPDLGLGDVPEGVAVVELADPLHRSVQLAFRSASADRPVIKAICEVLRRVGPRLAGSTAAA